MSLLGHLVSMSTSSIAIIITDLDASADFFHRRSTSGVLGPYNRLCAIHSVPIMSVADYYAHLLRATELCRLVGL